MSTYPEGLIELLMDLSACGTLPMSTVRGAAALFGGKETLQTALTQSLVRTEIVPTYFGQSEYLIALTRKGKDVLAEHGEDWSDIALDGLVSTSKTSDPAFVKASLERASKFNKMFLLTRSLGSVPLLPSMPTDPLPTGTTYYLTAGCCRRILWKERPELLRIGYCQGGVLIRDGVAWVINIMMPHKVWSKISEETAAAAFSGLAHTLFGHLETNLLFVGESMDDAAKIKPRGKRSSRLDIEVYGRYPRACFITANAQGGDILKNLLDPDGQRAARKRWVPNLRPPDRAHALYDGITPEGRPVLLGHTCDLNKLHAIAASSMPEKPLVLCLPGQGKALRMITRSAAEVREVTAGDTL